MALDPVQRNNLIIISLGCVGAAGAFYHAYSTIQKVGRIAEIKQLTYLQTLKKYPLQVLNGLGSLALIASVLKTTAWAYKVNTDEQSKREPLSLVAIFVFGAFSLLACLGDGLGDIPFDFTGGAGGFDL